MRFFRAIWVLGLAGWFCAQGGADPLGSHVSAVLHPLGDRVFALPARGIRVDGVLEEWDFRQSPLVISRENSAIASETGEAPDVAVRILFRWDERFLYVAAQIADDHVVPMKAADAMPWTCDSLMLVFDALGAVSASGRYQQRKNVPTSREPFFGLSYYTPATGPRRWTPHSRYVAKKTADGYDLEAALSMGDIGYAPAVGDRFKVAVVVPDVDPGKVLRQLQWPARWQAAGAVSNPTSFWADLRLRGDAPFAGDVLPDRSRYTPQRPVRVICDLNAFARGLVVRELRVKNAEGTLAASLPVAKAIPEDRTLRLVGEFGPLSEGRYSVSVAVAAGESVRNGTVKAPFEVIASKEVEMGVSGKLPARYLVPDPSREAFPSSKRDYRRPAITKADYAKLVRMVYEHSPHLWEQKEPQPNRFGYNYALYPYVMWRTSGEVKYYEQALRQMRNCYLAAEKGDVAVHLPQLSRTIRLFLADPQTPARDKEWLEGFYVKAVHAMLQVAKPTERGAMNRSILWAAALAIALQWEPDAPERTRWQPYIELVWNDWWPYRDQEENSSDYNTGCYETMMIWLDECHPDKVKDPQWLAGFERFIHQVSPCGGRPGYGDASPWNGSFAGWMPIFERLATLTHDGRYKWAAHKLLEYANLQMDDWFSYHMVYDGAAVGAAWSYLYADDSIPEESPSAESRILYRKAVLPVTPEEKERSLQEHGIGAWYFRLEDRLIPDKLVLKGGDDEFDLWGLVELCPSAGHAIGMAPHFCALVDHRAVLLTDLGYFEKGPEYHNLVLVQDLTGIAPAAGQEIIEVPVFKRFPAFVYAKVTVDNYKNWPLLNDRRIFFAKNELVVVKDIVHFHERFVCRLGQQWQTRMIGPKAGRNWVNVYLPFLLRSGLGLGRGVQKWKNPNRDLLIYYTEHAGRDYEVLDRTFENRWQALPLRIQQRWRGLPEPHKPVHFTSLLWPHKPTFEVEKLAGGISALADTPELTVFRVQLDGANVRYIAINDTGAVFEAGPLASDAEVLYLRTQVRDGTERPVYLTADGATVVSWQGIALASRAEKGTIQRDSF